MLSYAEEANGHNISEDTSPQTSPRTDGSTDKDGSADKEATKPNGKPAEPEKPKPAQPQTGEHAAQDARKALEDTVENLRVAELDRTDVTSADTV